jgi:phage/plasmid-associated DNA primase
LPSVLPDRKDYFKDRMETSVDKLLFADGIYDFLTSTFTLGFNPEVVFFGAVPRPFPKVRNEGAIEFVRTKFFRDPFKNPAVGDALIHFLARGLAGHYEAKKAVIAYGPENSTKGTLVKHLNTTLGSGLMGAFQGDSLLMRTGDTEATKALSWVKKFCDKRIATSSEISIDPLKPRPINGNLLKSLSGGGDPIILRTNHKDEEEVFNKALTFIFVNDLPPIAPPDPSVRDRLVTIPYSYGFVDEPKFAYQKPRDHTVSATLKTDTYRDATVWLLLDAIKAWDKQPYRLPEECNALKNDLAPMVNVEELLKEEYDLTGSPDDCIPTEELVAYLRSRKVDGSDRKIGDKLTQVGLETTVRREGRRTVRVRVGIRPAEM